MKLRKANLIHSSNWLGVCVIWTASIWMTSGWRANAEQFTTTTVQGTVYSASGLPSAGSLQLSWQAFTTASNQAVAAGRKMVAIGSDGFVSVNLAPNVGATPAGLYYTAIYHLGDGTTSTECWVVPSAAQASLGQIRAQLMPAAQAVQAVSKKYVDQSIQEMTQSLLTASGGNLSGPLYLNGDPQVPTQAANKHYVDSAFSLAVPMSGASMTGPLTSVKLGAVYQADQFPGADFGAKLQACIQGLDQAYGGTCDARNLTSAQSMGSDLTISTANVTVELPCATIATGRQIIVTSGTRNVTLHGCGLRGASGASGSKGGTVFLYSGTSAMVQVGDPSYLMNTPGFHLDNAVINTTAADASTAQGLVAYRTQELDLEGLYLLGNSNQTGITLDGTGNYTGGTLQDVELGGFAIAINAIGHQVANSATTDWLNASTFVRLHINCPTSGGNPILGTFGINLQQGDGNTFTGGDVEGCSTALHLGLNAQNNTFVGLRNENSTYQVVADAGSSFNSWMTGGTMFTGKLVDGGTRNSFLDTFHRSFNGMNGDWFGSQQDSTLMNHYRLGIGTGAERGLQDRYQTDFGYRWTTGLSDATAGEQFYQVLDELNSVYRLSIGQYNFGQPSTNNQTVMNAAGTGAVVLNGSKNAGTGGVVFGAGGADGATVATINNAGNAQFNGTLEVGGSSTFTSSTTIKNQADTEVDAFLWAGATKSQKESLVYKDWNGTSQWYMLKDASNNWALNSATGGLDSFKAYQSSNSGDTYINASNGTGHIRLNYETGSGAETDIYSGSSSGLVAAFLGPTAVKLPGLASGSGRNCLQIDSSGYITNTGTSCGAGGGSGVVNAGIAGQVAYYGGNGSVVSGMNAVSISAGGTGASTAAEALQSLGGQSAMPGVASDGASGLQVSGNVTAGAMALSSDHPTGHQAASANAAVITASVLAYGAKADWMPGPYDYSAIPCNVTNGSNVMYCASGTFTSADVGKYITPTGLAVQPFSTKPSTAQIVTVTDGQHLVLSRSAILTTGMNIQWGTDDVPGIMACQLAVYNSGGGTCTFPAGRYLLATAPYSIVIAGGDDGSYGTPAGGSGAVLSCTASAGKFSGCTVNNGGSGYTPNSTLGVTITGGCTTPLCGGAGATATSNNSGVITGVTTLYTGYGYGSNPTGSVRPLGGDGAAATVTISGGSINNTTITAAGAGYSPNSSLNVYGINGTSCATVTSGIGINVTAKGTATTNSSGQVSSISWSNPGSGCTTAPAVIFSDFGACNTGTVAVPVWSQCTNLAPVTAAAFPVQLLTLPNVSLVGSGSGVSQASVLSSVWDNYSVDNNQPIMLAGPIQNQDIKNLSFNNGFFGIAVSNNANDATLKDLNFTTNIGMWTSATDAQSQFENLTFSTNVPWVNGGRWVDRRDVILEGGGFFDANHIKDVFIRSNGIKDSVDDWWAANFWHPEFSARSTDFLESCTFPQIPNQRQTGHHLGDVHQGNSACYPGVTGIGLEILPRNNRGTGFAILENLRFTGGARPIFYGSMGGMQVINAGCEGCNPLTTDRYRTATQQEGAIEVSDASGSSINVGWSGGNVTNCIWQFGSANGAPTLLKWRTAQNFCANTSGQVLENANFLSAQSFPGLTIVNSNGASNQLWIQGRNGNADQIAGAIKAYFNGSNHSGLSLMWNDGATSLADYSDTGITFHSPFSLASMALGSGTAVTGTVGNGGRIQETNATTKMAGNCASFDTNGNTVDAGFACVAGAGGILGSGVGGVTDNFFRSAGALGSTWSGSANITVASSGNVGDTNSGAVSNDFAFFTPNTFSANQCSQFTMSALPSSGSWLALTVRNIGGSYYSMLVFNGGSTYLYKNTPTISMIAGPASSTSLTVGDTFKLCASGTTITGYHNGSSYIAATDSAIAGPGLPGIGFGNNNAARISNFTAIDLGGISGGLSVTLGGSPLPVGCTNQPPVTVTGATTSMVCQMSGAGGNPSNVQPQCTVTAANTVTPALCTAVATTPTSQSFNVRVIQ